ncbi:uncharacterized protein LOC129619304 [Condylostylus longicornis]|uniref:uncharacterized protein LOC129619304 n=1 Tax=Condylostylus longicornis TaxID=2530218 RepID=UPI00244E288A|nr:uncharacterized protein LOC129619304 [Condylostylus longicornis]
MFTNNKNDEIILKIINFLKEKPYFYDESNPLFYDAFKKSTEKNHLARSFDPPLTVAVISAKIRYIISKVIDNYELNKNDKKAKWKYFKETKFMIPALLFSQKSCKFYQNNDLTFQEYQFNNNSRWSKFDNQEGEKFLLKKISKKTENPEESYCKICNFFCPTHLFHSHFELRYHQRGETYWKNQKNIDVIQCPCCDLLYKTWLEFFKHIKIHQLQDEDINYKVFKFNNRKLCIDLNSDLPSRDESSAQLFHKIKRLSQKGKAC